MSLPYATRCAMQALRESGDERAQRAYEAMVQAFVSGSSADIKAAEQAMEHAKRVPLGSLSQTPWQCHTDEFTPLHASAISTAAACGVQLPDVVLSEQRSADVRTSVAYLAVVFLLVVLCVVIHAWIQKCKPSNLCSVRG